MFKQARFSFYVDSDPHQTLRNLEALVPGVLVYSQGRPGLRRFRIREPSDYDAAVEVGFEVVSPLNCAYLAEAWMRQGGCTYNARPHNGGDRIMPYPVTVEGVQALVDRGRTLLQQMVQRGEVKEHVLDMVTQYQLRGIGWSAGRPWTKNVWACGSGKTLGTMLSALTVPGPVLVVAPAKARHVWWSQVQEYTNVEPYRVKPAGDMRKRDEVFEAYLSRIRAEGKRPFVVIGLEALADYMPQAVATAPTTLVLDEIHYHGNNRRWKAVHSADGTVDFTARTTTKGNEARAVSVMAVSQLGTLKQRIGLTATPLDDGRPRRLWSQLDLLWPGGFAYSYRKFALRYCGAELNQWGGMDDKGAWRATLSCLRLECRWSTWTRVTCRVLSVGPMRRLTTRLLRASRRRLRSTSPRRRC